MPSCHAVTFFVKTATQITSSTCCLHKPTFPTPSIPARQTLTQPPTSLPFPINPIPPSGPANPIQFNPTNPSPTGLCSRRHWPEPLFQPIPTPSGHWTCTVRVNNREYTTGQSIAYATEALARDAAATQAYMICRSFSHNDGMCPGARPGAGPGVQGMPVAIGSGRNSTAAATRRELRLQSRGTEEAYALAGESASSGGESPRSVDSGVGGECRCRRKAMGGRYQRCEGCREAGWMP